jgi:hypothetical protein
MYAADRLREHGHTVAVLEKTGRVGGHSETYRSGLKFYNIGVRVYRDTPLLRQVFAKYGVPLERVDNHLPNRYFDSRTGERSAYEIPPPAAILESMLRYIFLLRTRYGYLHEPGIHLPNPVPEDLLMPFGKWLERHGLEKKYAPLTHYLQGMGSVSRITALYAFKNLRAHIAESVLFNSFVAPVTGVEHLYHRMAERLGSDLHLSATLRSVARAPGRPIEVIADTPAGALRITCDRLLVCCPPLLDNLAPLDLSPTERDLFGRFKYRHYSTAIAEIEGIPTDTIHSNVAADPVNDDIHPSIYTIMPTPFPGRYNVLYGSDVGLPEETIKAHMERDINKLNFGPGRPPVEFKGFDLFKSHLPYDLHVSPDDIRAGFYDRLNALQGQRDTWYLGAAMDTHDTAAVWAHAEATLDAMRGERWYFPPRKPPGRLSRAFSTLGALRERIHGITQR